MDRLLDAEEDVFSNMIFEKFDVERFTGSENDILPDNAFENKAMFD